MKRMLTMTMRGQGRGNVGSWRRKVKQRTGVRGGLKRAEKAGAGHEDNDKENKNKEMKTR